ncbi:SpoIIAA family protein [Nitrococcus mobilis]|uniref:STAS/SEC14 domain-containing protein n=1 Tax=Nitrococcus mobilis Nb-231 TaxID=314278 RepID=A4BRB9_9GAMM|nr:STAS/SEC14 domain-containing protein [Nitrococcus mobilis]EAR21741.1 hypothetical protein NB231_03390 [Nitrococcus mobilis Nb-231]
MTTASEQVLAITISGILTADDIEQYRTALKEKLARHERIGLWVDFSELADVSAEALFAGVKADLELFGRLDRFTRYALVSDKQWPQALIDFLQPLFPARPMQLFPSAQRAMALQWAAEATKPPTSVPPAVRFLPTTADDVLAFEINDVTAAPEMPDVTAKFNSFLVKHDRVRLLNRIRHFAGIDPKIFMQSGLVSMKLAALQKVGRYAIGGALTWMAEIIETMNPAFTDIDMRVCPADQEAAAWRWIGPQPTGTNKSRGAR